MRLSGAERQRRHRLHIKGDHSLCEAARNCEEQAPHVFTGLETAGRRLWRELDGAQASGATRVLMLEACRMADRLERLHRLLNGDAEDWLRIVDSRGNPDRQELVINAPLAEARQQATALKQIIAELRQAQPTGARSTPKGVKRAKATAKPGGGSVSGVTDLTARIAERRGQTTS